MVFPQNNGNTFWEENVKTCRRSYNQLLEPSRDASSVAQIPTMPQQHLRQSLCQDHAGSLAT